MQGRAQRGKTPRFAVASPFRLVVVLVVVLSAAPATAAETGDHPASLASPPPSSGDCVGAGDERSLVSLPSLVGDLRYTPGHGLKLSRTRITIGGYTNLNLTRDESDPARIDWDELSFIVVADPAPRVHLFSELELEHLARIDDQGHGGAANATFHGERLYGDFTVSDALSLRTGKFLSPVGRWNVIHASPLVWTTSRPLVTFLPFDPHTTGAMVFGSLFPAAGSLRYSLFGQFVDQFEPSPDFPPVADRSAGAHLEYGIHANLAIGASYVESRRAGEWQHLGGMDALWRYGPMELVGEFAATSVSHAGSIEWGLYLQDAIEVWRKLYFIGRYEHFNQPAQRSESNLVVLGLAYRPIPYLILKAEYLIADHPAEESPPGFKSSLAVLF